MAPVQRHFRIIDPGRDGFAVEHGQVRAGGAAEVEDLARWCLRACFPGRSDERSKSAVPSVEILHAVHRFVFGLFHEKKSFTARPICAISSEVSSGYIGSESTSEAAFSD